MARDLQIGEPLYALRASETPRLEWLRNGFFFSRRYQLVTPERMFVAYQAETLLGANARFATADGRFRIKQTAPVENCFTIEHLDGRRIATMDGNWQGSGALVFTSGWAMEIGARNTARYPLSDANGHVLARCVEQGFGRFVELQPGFDSFPEALFGVVVALHIARRVPLTLSYG